MSEADTSSSDALYPFEFIIQGTPKSLQAEARSRRRWKDEVRGTALQRVREVAEFTFFDDRPLALTIFYFPNAPMRGDIDNIVKPIMDALEGVAYLRDPVVERVVVQRFEPAATWQFAEPSEQLAKALGMLRADALISLVYCRVDDDLKWRML